MLFDDNFGFITYDLYSGLSGKDQGNTKLVNVDEGFLRGNMFAKEYKPYKNYTYKKIIPRTKREELLLEIMEMSFAINDLNLYLDLHPEDTKMLEKCNEYVERSYKYEMEYVKNYGPIEVIDNTSNEKFEWIKNPWPWENEGGTKYV